MKVWHQFKSSSGGSIGVSTKRHDSVQKQPLKPAEVAGTAVLRLQSWEDRLQDCGRLHMHVLEIEEVAQVDATADGDGCAGEPPSVIDPDIRLRLLTAHSQRLPRQLEQWAQNQRTDEIAADSNPGSDAGVRELEQVEERQIMSD
ncbi:hypothetical protein HK405_008148, partial [Cladochytrium tenue]